jgi:hypothetical protein
MPAATIAPARRIHGRLRVPGDKSISHRYALVAALAEIGDNAQALRLAAFETNIVEMSWYGTETVPIALGNAFHSKRLSLISSQVGRVAASQRARWDHRRRMELALSMLTEPALDALITGESEFETLPDTMAQLAEGPGDTICHRIRYSSA